MPSRKFHAFHIAWVALFVFLMAAGNPASAGTVHVWTGAPTPGEPYNTWDTAAHDIQTAINYAADHSGDYQTVLVTNGAYGVTARILLDAALTVISVNGADHTTIARTGSGNHRVITVNHADAELEGFTIANGRPNGASQDGTQHGAGVYLKSGTVRHCIISGNEAGNGSYGGGIRIEGGVVEDCIIENNYATGTHAYGGGVFMNAGALRRSRVRNNFMWGSNQTEEGCGISMSGSAEVENCLVYGNAAGGNAGNRRGAAVYINGGTLRHTTVAGNSVTNHPVGGIQRGNSGTILNCIAYGNRVVRTDNTGSQVTSTTGFTYSCAPELTAGTGNTSRDPEFFDLEARDFRLRPGSPGIDTGDNYPGMGTLDADQNPRVVNGQTDMGALEANLSVGALDCNFVAATNAAFGSLEAVFTAYFSGTDTNIVNYAWDFGDTQTLSGADRRVVTNQYNAPGLYTVTLNVENASTDTAMRERTHYIRIYAPTNYVSLEGNHMFPFVTWQNAATNIQDAIDATGVIGDLASTVLVSNGVYNLSQQLMVTSGISVISFEGPDETVLQRVASGSSAPQHRIVTLAHPDQSFAGFTVTNGYISASGNNGAGILMTGGTVSNCTVVGNINAVSSANGAGIYMTAGLVTHCRVRWNRTTNVTHAYGGGINMTGGTLRNSIIEYNTITSNQGNRGSGVTLTGGSTVMENCLVRFNTASAGNYTRDGGAVGIQGGTLRNVTITQNSVTNTYTCGLYRSGGTVKNSIVHDNTHVRADNQTFQIHNTASPLWTSITYTCSPDLTDGTGNIAANPLLADDARLSAASPCIDEGDNEDWMLTATDLDGNERIINGKVDLGAFEFDSSAGPLGCDFSAHVMEGFDELSVTFTPVVTGPHTNIAYYWWDFGDGNTDEGGALAQVQHAYTAPGSYTVSLTVSNTTEQVADRIRYDFIAVHPSVNYVSLDGNHVFPFESWERAATNLQTAIDAAGIVGPQRTTVVVSNGIYGVDAEVAITKGIAVHSLAGPTATVLYRIGPADHRVLRIEAVGAEFSGFTVTNGWLTSGSGPGALITSATVSNCVFQFNRATGTASQQGGAIYMSGGTLTHAIVANNEADGTHAVGGGIQVRNGGLVLNCIVRSNRLNSSQWSQGTGIAASGGSIVRNTLVTGNWSAGGNSGDAGGAIYANNSTVENCTVSTNSVVNKLSAGITAASSATIRNCIVFGNTPNDVSGTGFFTYSCAPELTSGTGNITSDPLFRSPGTGDYTLSHGSEAIAAGFYDASWMANATDLAGNPRHKRNLTVDLGAYESQPPGGSLFLLR